jgi:hypothetical protein
LGAPAHLIIFVVLFAACWHAAWQFFTPPRPYQITLARITKIIDFLSGTAYLWIFQLDGTATEQFYSVEAAQSPNFF